MMQSTNICAGYPSIDKPWLKYYDKELMSKEYSYESMYDAIWESNKSNLKDTAFHYFGRKISYGQFFEQVRIAANAFQSVGVHPGDTVTIAQKR